MNVSGLIKGRKKIQKKGRRGQQQGNPATGEGKTEAKPRRKRKAEINPKNTESRTKREPKNRTQKQSKSQRRNIEKNPEKNRGKTHRKKDQKTGEQHSGIRGNRSRALAGYPSRLRLLNQRASQANKQRGTDRRPREKQEPAHKQGSKTQKRDETRGINSDRKTRKTEE